MRIARMCVVCTKAFDEDKVVKTTMRENSKIYDAYICLNCLHEQMDEEFYDYYDSDGSEEDEED